MGRIFGAPQTIGPIAGISILGGLSYQLCQIQLCQIPVLIKHKMIDRDTSIRSPAARGYRMSIVRCHE